MKTFDFLDRTIVVTGANGDIARAVTLLFSSLGARLVLSDIEETGLREFARSLEGPSVVVRQDVSSAADADVVADAALRSFGKIDHVIASAAIYPEAVFEEITHEQWRRTLAINLDGVFLTARACLPHMREGGSIVNVSSMAAHTGSIRHADYAASKGGVLSLTRSMARELGPHVRVNAVSPGLIDTQLSRGSLLATNEATIQQTPMKRIGLPQDIAHAVAFLCSDWASYITGEVMHVNGGFRME